MIAKSKRSTVEVPKVDGMGSVAETQLIQARAIGTRSGTRLIRGREAILGLHGALVELCARCGQTGAMDYLEYFLSVPNTAAKRPHLVLLSAAAEDGRELLTGAVLMQEYTMAGVGLKVYVSDDVAGERTVVAPAGSRTRAAAMAAEWMMREAGARVVLLSYKEDEPLCAGDAAGLGLEGTHQRGGRWLWARREREMTRHLPLLDSTEATFAMLGKHTRRNLRYYRRRAEADLGCRFVPEVELGREEFLAILRACSYPVPARMALWRYRALEGLPGRLFAGVRAANGDWLSLIAGRRHHGVTEIDWQVNRAGLPGYSLSTVMRAYLLEDEIARGTRELYFEGGTPHSMRHSFLTHRVKDLIVMRQSLPALLLRRFARRLLPETNFLAQTMAEPGLEWRPGVAEGGAKGSPARGGWRVRDAEGGLPYNR